MSQPLPYAVIKFIDTVSLEKVLSTPNNADNIYVIEVGLKHTKIAT